MAIIETISLTDFALTLMISVLLYLILASWDIDKLQFITSFIFFLTAMLAQHLSQVSFSMLLSAYLAKVPFEQKWSAIVTWVFFTAFFYQPLKFRPAAWTGTLIAAFGTMITIWLSG